MAHEPKRPIAVVRTVSDVFDAAAPHASRRVRTVLVEEGRTEEVARSTADAVSAALRAALVEAPDAPLAPALLADPLTPAFLETLAEELLRLGDDPSSARPTIRLLATIATVRAASAQSGRSESEARLDDLRARLHAPDAFELLVEVAHDFRSPLTSILFLAETMRDGVSGPVTELQRSQLGLTYSAAFGLASVASDIMDLARREQGLVDGDGQPYALSEVFESVQRLVSPIVEEKGLELRISVPEITHSHGHPHALSRVLLNLTTNALKFTDEGYVSIGVTPRQGRLEYWVEDTGRGIPEQRRDELFQPFKRRLGENRDGHFFSGSGVGLSIARRLVRAMGSELVLERSDERGTRFSFVVSQGPSRWRVDR